MGQKNITLSGAASDVLHALFFRGALQSGDLPAKSGATELRALGFAETCHTATEYQKENYFTFLTPKGQQYAVDYFVDGRPGAAKIEDVRIFQVSLKLDTAEAQQKIDEIMKHCGAFSSLIVPVETLYEAVFELKDGKKVLGYSDKDEPSLNCGFYRLAATKELKGRVAVLASDVISFRFTPL